MKAKSFILLMAVAVSGATSAQDIVQGIRISFNDEMPVANIAFEGTPAISHNSQGDVILNATGLGQQIYDASDIKQLEHLLDVSKTFAITATADIKNDGNYYATFFSSRWAYKVPDGVKAYTGIVESSSIVLSEIITGIIPAGVAVILKSTTDSYNLTANDCVDGVETNQLLGTDVETDAPDDCYVLAQTSLGLGLYQWDSAKKLAANKAYLVWKEEPLKAFSFIIDGEKTTDIQSEYLNSETESNGLIYNLNGQAVDEYYNGIVISNGSLILKD
ncbi:MAG: hypothetical protein MJY71_02925 [Bacteroidaceae bacterium]|nr:hypothetical protein [Bacteroidaceae bacterium]